MGIFWARDAVCYAVLMRSSMESTVCAVCPNVPARRTSSRLECKEEKGVCGNVLEKGLERVAKRLPRVVLDNASA